MIIIRKLTIALAACLLVAACGGGASTQNTKTAVFTNSDEAKAVVQEIIDALLVPELVVLELGDALARVLQGNEAECGNTPVGTVEYELQGDTVTAVFTNCESLTNGEDFIAGTLDGTVVANVLSDTAERQEILISFNGFRLDDQVFPFGVEGNARLLQLSDASGAESTQLTSTDFALLFEGRVLRFIQLDNFSETLSDGTERLDFRGDLDGFGFDGVAGFDTLVPVVINGVSGEVEQGELLFEGSNFATIRIIDKPEPESPDLADVEIDYDGDGEIDAIELWTWFGDIFPP